MRTHIKELRETAWKKEWNESPGMRQSKLFLQGPQPEIWKDLKNCNQQQTSRIVRFLTGHSFMARHNTAVKYKIRGEQADYHEESACRLCAEAEETPEHLITNCAMTSWARQMTFYTMELDSPPQWSKSVKEFANTPAIRKLEDDDSYQTGGI